MTTTTYKVYRVPPSRSGLGADEVLISPREEKRQSNPRARKVATLQTWEAEAVSNYNGHENLLVRTALIRPPSFIADSGPVIRTSADVERLTAHLKHADQEHMVVLSLNSQNKVVAIHEVAIGTATGAAFQFRDAVKTVILSGGQAAIIVHNHPSGSRRPSQDDLQVTRKVKEALECVQIRLLDHIIVSLDGHYSFANEGAI